MQKISEVMTRDVRTVTPQDNLQQTARLMADLDVGALPVCDGQRLLGMVTDRDITIRATAEGLAPQDTRVERVMTHELNWCFEDEALDDVMARMAGSQVRRIPVVSRDKRLVGIIALGDLVTRARGADEDDVQDVMQQVSKPNGGAGVRQGMQPGQGAGMQSGQAGNRQSGAAGSRGGSVQFGQGMDGPLATGDGTGGHIGPDTESGD